MTDGLSWLDELAAKWGDHAPSLQGLRDQAKQLNQAPEPCLVQGELLLMALPEDEGRVEEQYRRALKSREKPSPLRTELESLHLRIDFLLSQIGMVVSSG